MKAYPEDVKKIEDEWQAKEKAYEVEVRKVCPLLTTFEVYHRDEDGWGRDTGRRTPNSQMIDIVGGVPQGEKIASWNTAPGVHFPTWRDAYIFLTNFHPLKMKRLEGWNGKIAEQVLKLAPNATLSYTFHSRSYSVSLGQTDKQVFLGVGPSSCLTPDEAWLSALAYLDPNAEHTEANAARAMALEGAKATRMERTIRSQFDDALVGKTRLVEQTWKSLCEACGVVRVEGIGTVPITMDELRAYVHNFYPKLRATLDKGKNVPIILDYVTNAIDLEKAMSIKITKTDKKDTTSFGNIEVGSCFELNGKLLLRTQDVYDCDASRMDAEPLNTLCLSSCKFMRTAITERVVKVPSIEIRYPA